MYIVLTIVDTQLSLFIFFIEFMNKMLSIEKSVYE